MNEFNQTPAIYPAAIAEMSVSDLAKLSIEQKRELDANLDQAIGWLKKARTKFDAALDQCYGERARAQLSDEGKDSGTTHIHDSGFDITVEIGKDIKYEAKGLAELAAKIAATGGDPREYIEIKYEVSEAKYKAWPQHLREPFERLRTVTPKKAKFTLSRVGEKT